MILLESATSEPGLVTELGVFAGQLRSAGLHVTLAKSRLPDGMTVTQRFELLQFIEDTDAVATAGMIVIGAETEDPAHLARFRDVPLEDDAPVLAIGAFASRADRVEAASRLGFATDRTVTTIDLADLRGVQAGRKACPCFGVETPTVTAPWLRGKKPLQFLGVNAAKNGLFPAIQALQLSIDYVPVTYCSTADKEVWSQMQGPGHQVYAFAEMAPWEFSALGGVVVVTGRPGSNFRAQAALNNLIAQNALIIDASPEGELIADGVPALRGPADLTFLPSYLRDVVLPNASSLAASLPRSPLTQSIRMDRFLAETPFAEHIQLPEKVPETAPGISFLPTNGVGLGHAQRCSLVAGALPKADTPPHFFAFPSCLPMIQRFGFDATPLVSRTELHKTKSDNDLINYGRLTFGIEHGDVFIFDGGHVFSSVLRTILERRLNAVWIRRGMWKAVQDNRIPLDREKVFRKVIVPGEALGDPTEVLSQGDHVHNVGPIVQVLPEDVRREDVIADLKERFDMDFDRLVVSMLGSGILSDRSVQMQVIASQVEQRDDTLHLIVVWPTAPMPPAAFGWKRTKIVQTHHAAVLQKAADMLISAVGFNTFHETLYNQIPTLYIPQVATSLDDQTKRAETAAEMGVAALLPDGRIGLIEREIRSFLDRGKSEDMRAKLAALDLPEPGNAEAARVIAGMAAEGRS